MRIDSQRLLIVGDRIHSNGMLVSYGAMWPRQPCVNRAWKSHRLAKDWLFRGAIYKMQQIAVAASIELAMTEELSEELKTN